MRRITGELLLLGAGALAASCGREGETPALPASSGRVLANWTPESLVVRRDVDLAALFPYAGDMVFDAQAGLLLPPNMASHWKWREHPQKSYEQHTDSLGLLRTEELGAKKGLRFLVLGDSHLMSVNAAESFPDCTQRELRKRGHSGAEVINAGVPYTGPRMYLMRLRRHLALELDGVVVSLFTGNDFWDDVNL